MPTGAARATESGFVAKAGSEIEVYLFRDSYETARAKGYRNLEPLGRYIEDYYIFPGTKEEPLVGAIVRGLSGSGVPIENSKGEWGPGQQEINLEFCDVIEQADRNVLYKHAAREIADQQGLAVTFMAKWDENLAGSSMHQHLSLWDGGEGAPRAGRVQRRLPLVPRRLDGARARALRVLRAFGQLVQALPERLVRAHRDRVGGRQPDRRVPRRGAR